MTEPTAAHKVQPLMNLILHIPWPVGILLCLVGMAGLAFGKPMRGEWWKAGLACGILAWFMWHAWVPALAFGGIAAVFGGIATANSRGID